MQPSENYGETASQPPLLAAICTDWHLIKSKKSRLKPRIARLTSACIGHRRRERHRMEFPISWPVDPITWTSAPFRTRDDPSGPFCGFHPRPRSLDLEHVYQPIALCCRVFLYITSILKIPSTRKTSKPCRWPWSKNTYRDVRKYVSFGLGICLAQV